MDDRGALRAVLKEINTRVSYLIRESDPYRVGPLKYSGSWQRRAAADHIAIDELRWAKGLLADALAQENA